MSHRADEPRLHAALRLHALGRFEEAIAICNEEIERDEANANAHYVLGLVFHSQSRLGDAENAYRAALLIDPCLPQALCNLGLVLANKGDFGNAIQCLEKGAALSAQTPEMFNNLGMVLNAAGRPGDAIPHLRKAIFLRPDMVEAHNNLGIALQRIGEAGSAIEAFRTAARIQPNRAETFNNLGAVLTKVGRLDDAIACYERAVTLAPANAEAHRNFGIALKDAGHLDAALSQIDEAIALRPDYQAAHSDRLYLIHFHPDRDAGSIFQVHHQWNAKFASPLRGEIQRHANEESVDRKLRVGYVSADLRDHVIGRFMAPLITHHDRNRFEIICYSDLVQPDAMTLRLRRHIDAWRSIAGLSDTAVAEMIREDRIDILVDLAMHMGGSRIMVFARKPAPVQVTYLAYCGTTGLDTIDYRFTDPYLDPVDGSTAGFYSETSIHLPKSYWCYEPPDVATEIAEVPALSSGPITFGCLNAFCKINRHCMETWSGILLALPDSRLIIHAGEGSHRKLFLERMEEMGVNGSRVSIVGYQPFQQYFDQYQEIDIALDPFPYAGGTTTCDALWMGVPVVTLAGQAAVGRAGVSLMSNAGLPELIATSRDQYAQTAINLAGDVNRRIELRQSLRTRLLQSPLMDGPGFARDVEAAYIRMWECWIATQ